MNVLVDDDKKAVLCDFGLSRVKADVTSRTAILGTAVITGSRNWMSPERLNGGMVRKPSDIYAFGMVIYEVNPSAVCRGVVSNILIIRFTPRKLRLVILHMGTFWNLL
jgi:serine/threonine protein kinase